jgi:hypothetical protein
MRYVLSSCSCSIQLASPGLVVQVLGMSIWLCAAARNDLAAVLSQSYAASYLYWILLLLVPAGEFPTPGCCVRYCAGMPKRREEGAFVGLRCLEPPCKQT